MSDVGRMDKTEVIKVVKGTGVAAAGAGAFYLIEFLTTVDFGEWTPAVVATLAVVSNIIRKWLTKNQA